MNQVKKKSKLKAVNKTFAAKLNISTMAAAHLEQGGGEIKEFNLFSEEAAKVSHQIAQDILHLILENVDHKVKLQNSKDGQQLISHEAVSDILRNILSQTPIMNRENSIDILSDEIKKLISELNALPFVPTKKASGLGDQKSNVELKLINSKVQQQDNVIEKKRRFTTLVRNSRKTIGKCVRSSDKNALQKEWETSTEAVEKIIDLDVATISTVHTENALLDEQGPSTGRNIEKVPTDTLLLEFGNEAIDECAEGDGNKVNQNDSENVNTMKSDVKKRKKNWIHTLFNIFKKKSNK